MSDPFLGEIRLTSFTFAPRGWAFCCGQLLPITQNQALFSLLGINYGGDGRTNFALPDMRGRVPIHKSTVFNVGQSGGEETHTLTLQELSAHTHNVMATNAEGTDTSPSGKMPASSGDTALFAPATSPSAGSLNSGPTGGSQAHENRQPYLCLNFIIALQGIFPSRD